MFPVGCATSCYQAAAEADFDLCALLHASDAVEARHPALGPPVLKYGAVALLACVDVLSELGGRVRKAYGAGLFEEDQADTLDRHKAFHQACERNTVEVRLRDFVRNTVSAHRTVQSVESHHETHTVLRSEEFGQLFEVTRKYLYALGAMRIWFWAGSSKNGLTLRRCRVLHPTAWRNLPSGLAVPPSFGGSGGPTFLDAEDVAEELEFSSRKDARAHANAFWGLADQELKCCGRGQDLRWPKQSPPRR